jgi:hypothetical protein
VVSFISSSSGYIKYQVDIIVKIKIVDG